MKIFILAAGPDQGWKGNSPKQLVPINGEPLLLRVLRELRERGYQATVVTNKSEITDLVDDFFEPAQTDTIFHTILSTRELWEDEVLILLGDVLYTDKFYDQMFDYEGETPICFDSIGLFFDMPDYERVIDNLETLGAVPWESYFNRLWLHGDIPKVETGPHTDFDNLSCYDKFLAKWDSSKIEKSPEEAKHE